MSDVTLVEQRSGSNLASEKGDNDDDDPIEAYEEPHRTSTAEDQQNKNQPLQKWNTGTSASSGGRTIVGFAPNDSGSPYNWSQVSKTLKIR